MGADELRNRCDVAFESALSTVAVLARREDEVPVVVQASTWHELSCDEVLFSTDNGLVERTCAVETPLVRRTSEPVGWLHGR